MLYAYNGSLKSRWQDGSLISDSTQIIEFWMNEPKTDIIVIFFELFCHIHDLPSCDSIFYSLHRRIMHFPSIHHLSSSSSTPSYHMKRIWRGKSLHIPSLLLSFELLKHITAQRQFKYPDGTDSTFKVAFWKLPVCAVVFLIRRWETILSSNACISIVSSRRSMLLWAIWFFFFLHLEKRSCVQCMHNWKDSGFGSYNELNVQSIIKKNSCSPFAWWSMPCTLSLSRVGIMLCVCMCVCIYVPSLCASMSPKRYLNNDSAHHPQIYIVPLMTSYRIRCFIQWPPPQ